MRIQFRPIFCLSNVVALIMMGYAAGVLITPSFGITAFIDRYTFLTPELIALSFVLCGAIIFLTRPAPNYFSLLVIPVLLYAIASLVFFLDSNQTRSLTEVVGNIGVWLVINSTLYERARRGAN